MTIINSELNFTVLLISIASRLMGAEILIDHRC